jgi:hypothetical protein
MKPAYIAAPYGALTRDEIEINILRALALGRIAADLGFAPVVPHATGAALFGSEAGENGAAPTDRARIRALEAGRAQARAVALAGGVLFVLLKPDGSMSEGTAIEFDAFREVGGMVHYFILTVSAYGWRPTPRDCVSYPPTQPMFACNDRRIEFVPTVFLPNKGQATVEIPAPLSLVDPELYDVDVYVIDDGCCSCLTLTSMVAPHAEHGVREPVVIVQDVPAALLAQGWTFPHVRTDTLIATLYGITQLGMGPAPARVAVTAAFGGRPGMRATPTESTS